MFFRRRCLSVFVASPSAKPAAGALPCALPCASTPPPTPPSPADGRLDVSMLFPPAKGKPKYEPSETLQRPQSSGRKRPLSR